MGENLLSKLKRIVYDNTKLIYQYIWKFFKVPTWEIKGTIDKKIYQVLSI